MLLVTCAILVRSGKTFVAQRSASMSPALKWEFPGGKLEAGESPANCIVRELQEEFGIQVKPIFQAPDFPFPSTGTPDLTLLPFVCELLHGEPKPTEHADCKWLKPSELNALDWSEADLPVLAWWQDKQQQF